MSVAYVDTSAVATVVFEERSAEGTAKRLASFARLLSSNLLDAELRAALSREGVPYSPVYVEHIEWVFPDRPLAAEMEAVLKAGHLRGADLWHVATALSAAPDPHEVTFITLDARQRAVAAELGFLV